MINSPKTFAVLGFLIMVGGGSVIDDTPQPCKVQNRRIQP
jgi:hypothetical protein